ncbi:acyltransferase [Skermanella sp. TT6]|uniref:Acyltransferase n=1 Tax=Skermanella cutis TaxID=2775420 RepID=A0ABX7B3U2_9PROT|nr:acyltransferase [Skermanella sp. TT6]QQP88987.1 acyltransferase [Skermanella sp. TT6]
MRDKFNIDELRGLACLLLVSLHVIGHDPSVAMRVPDDSWYRYAVDSWLFVRMPLFTFLSGLVYALRPVRREHLADFYGKKLRRLGIPLLIVAPAFFVLQALTPGTTASPDWYEFLTIPVLPYQHFWYLQALLLIFVLIGFLDAHGALFRPRPFLALSAAAVALNLTFGGTLYKTVDLFSVSQAAYLLPYFLLGVAFTRFHGALSAPPARIGAVAVLAAGALIHQASLWHLIPVEFGRTSLLALVTGSAAALVLVRAMPAVPLLNTLGRHSYAIFLHHMFFQAAVRILLMRLGADDWQIFLLATAGGCVGPMVLQRLASVNPWTRTALLGAA